jgi:lipopolysaccharide heptosyltransferase III
MSQRASGMMKRLDRVIGVPLVWLLGALRPKRGIPAEIRSIGLLKEACIGDTILFAGLLEDLRSRFPNAKLTVFVGPSNAAVARMLSNVDDVVQLVVTSPLRAIRELRNHPTDVLIDFGQWPRINALYSFCSKASYTVGFKTPGHHRHFSYDACVEHRNDRHELDNFRALLGAIGVESSSKPRIVPDAEPVLEGPYVVFHAWPGGTLSHVREWSCERWMELSRHVRAAGYQVVLTGAPADRDATETLRLKMGGEGVVNRAGLDPLRSVARLLADAKAVVSVNTGVMHLAAAVGSRVIGLNGPTSELRWGPVGDRAISVSVAPPHGGYLNLGFEYEGRPLDSMNHIDVSDVWERLKPMLEEPSFRLIEPSLIFCSR